MFIAERVRAATSKRVHQWRFRELRMSSGALIEPTTAEFSIDPECLPNYDLIVTEDDVPYESFFTNASPSC